MQIVDQNERKFALNPSKSFIVQAPAGSGKTSLLVDRYITLLNYVNNPEEILAITFTKKAAHEMRTRIIEKLDNKFSKWDLNKNPHRIRIQTIDSFCYFLVKQSPILTNINTGYNIVHDQIANFYYSKAIKELLNHTHDSSLYNILLHLNNNWEYIERLLLTMLKSREQWLPYIIKLRSINELRVHMEYALKNIIQQNIKQCLDLFSVKSLKTELFTIFQLTENCESNLSHILECNDIDMVEKSLNYWKKIANIFLTKQFLWKKNITKNSILDNNYSPIYNENISTFQSLILRIKEFIIKCMPYEDIRQILADIILLPSPKYRNEQWIVVESLLQILPLAVANLKMVFKDNMVVDHIEIAQAASGILDVESPNDFTLNLEYHLQHILIDEFQDTSLSQFQLLEKLINTWQQDDGRTIFIVGDPMQSIYSFREAQVGLFLHVQRYGIGNLKPISLTLVTNFRSTHTIINWINDHFKKVFPVKSDIMLGAVPFSAANAIIGDVESHVSVCVNEKHNEENEVLNLINILTEITKKYPDDNIAILVKARSHLKNIIPALKKGQFLYQTHGITTLFEISAIKDLFFLTRAIVDLTDKIAWLAILRAPWCGLNLKDLYKIANGSYELIWDNIYYDKYDEISQDGIYKLNKMKYVLNFSIENRLRIEWQNLIEISWLHLGGPATIINPDYMACVDVFFDLMPNPLEIEIFEKLLQMTPVPSTQNSKIQIMTIHKAKGLEFDHVIIPGIDRYTKHDEKKLMAWLEIPNFYNNVNFLIAPISFDKHSIESIYQYLRNIDSTRKQYESDRLLYVALTRAKKSIHILGDINKHNIKQSSKLSLSEKKKSIPIIDNTYFYLSNNWKNLLPSLDNQLIHSPILDICDNQPAIFGTIVHKCLNQLSTHQPTNIFKYNTEQQILRKKLLIQMGYINIDQGLELINTIIYNIWTDKIGQWIISLHLDAQNELGITLNNNGKIQNFIIDRTFVDKFNTRWIIDYKISQPGKSEHLKHFLFQEKNKYIDQMLKYAYVMNSMNSSRKIKIGIYFPLCKGWICIPYTF